LRKYTGISRIYAALKKLKIIKHSVIFTNLIGFTDTLRQWFPNRGTSTTSGTRRPSRWYANRPTTFCLSSQKSIHSYVFYLSGSVN